MADTKKTKKNDGPDFKALALSLAIECGKSKKDMKAMGLL